MFTTRTVASRCSAKTRAARLTTPGMLRPSAGPPGAAPVASVARWTVSLTLLSCPFMLSPSRAYQQQLHPYDADGGHRPRTPRVQCPAASPDIKGQASPLSRPQKPPACRQAIGPERLMSFCCALEPSKRDVVFR